MLLGVYWYLRQSEYVKGPRLTRFKNDIKVDLKRDIDSWADLEIKLGQYTARYGDDEVDDFLFVYRDLKEKLNAYIKAREDLADFSEKDAITDAFFKLLFDFYKSFPTNTRNRLLAKLENYLSSKTYDFITFNYTHILERCIALLPDPLRRRGNSNQFTDRLGTILHMHGKIDNAPLVGVDDPSQIHNVAFRSNRNVLRALVKPFMNEHLQENVTVRARNLINQNNIICILGTSLGNSDISWWHYISAWLAGNPNRLLVILWYSAVPMLNLHPDLRLGLEDRVRGHFMRQAGIDVSVEDRIIVHVYTNLFDVKLISDDNWEIDFTAF